MYRTFDFCYIGFERKQRKLVKGTYHDVHGKEEISSFKTTIDDLFDRITEGEKCSARMQCILLGMKMYHLLADAGFSPHIKK